VVDLLKKEYPAVTVTGQDNEHQNKPLWIVFSGQVALISLF
jgi:hypothetical protein